MQQEYKAMQPVWNYSKLRLACISVIEVKGLDKKMLPSSAEKKEDGRKSFTESYGAPFEVIPKVTESCRMNGKSKSL